MISKRKNINERKNIITQLNPSSSFAEQYRIIRTNIEFLSQHEPIQFIVVTSAEQGEGKTTTVVNLGTVMAQQGKKVLLIDADFGRPELHQFFGKNNNYGLTNVLLNNHSIEEVVISTSIENLTILTSGFIPSIKSDLIASREMTSFMETLKKTYDFILIDCPPIIENADSQVLANICDGSIIVVKKGKTKKDKLVIAKSNLMKGNARLLGAVLNEKKA